MNILLIFLNVKYIFTSMSSLNQTFELDEAEELRIFLDEGEEISILVRIKIIIINVLYPL